MNIEKAAQARIMILNNQSFDIQYVEDTTVYCIEEETGNDYQFNEEDIIGARFYKLVEF